MNLFEGQTMIDDETGLPMTEERLAEVRAMLMAHGIKISGALPDGVTAEQVQADVWDHLGGKKA